MKKQGLPISVVVTVKNDDVGIEKLKADLKLQTRMADEVIVIRAEENNNCSRGEGRNIGVKKARNEIIAVTDVGCRPHKDWLEKLTTPLLEDRGVVAGGGYRPVATTALQKAIVPYLVPKGGSSRNDLPASRSLAFTKKAWKLVGGYPEGAVSGAEDLEFARRLGDHPEIKMIFQPKALVDWGVPGTLGEFWRDIVKHTKGNIEIRFWPHLMRNVSVLIRWIIFWGFPYLIPVYLLWPIIKHAGRVSREAILWLPLVQLVADGAVVTAFVQYIMESWGTKQG